MVSKLSTGQWHKRVPDDLAGNLRFRKALLAKCRGNRDYQRAVIHAVKNDCLFFIKVFGWQMNPLKTERGRVGPFIPYQFQEDGIIARPETHGHLPADRQRGLLWGYEHSKTIALQKSRELGASWVMLFLQVWLCITTRMMQCLNISRSAAAVDDKSPNSLFWKIRFIHQHLPDWLKGEIDTTKFYFGYSETESVITGEASTAQAGVGGRAGLCNIDEFSKIKEDVGVRQNTANTADCRVFTGTHLGTNTELFRLCDPKLSPEVLLLTWHWSQHPEKWRGAYRWNPTTNQVEILDPDYDFPWDYQFVTDGRPTGGPFPGLRSVYYDKKCLEIGFDRGCAMELDINPSGATSQFFNAIAIHSLKQHTSEPLWEGDVILDPISRRLERIVYRAGGPFRMWILPLSESRMAWGRFAAGADIGFGTGATNTCLSIAQVGDSGSAVRVAEYVSPFIDPKAFCHVAVALCRFFHDARFCWERKGPGTVFAREFLTVGYHNYYRAKDESPSTKPGKESVLPGWNPEQENLIMLLSDYATALYGRRFINLSAEALTECLNFRFEDSGSVGHSQMRGGNDPSGARVNHGDRATADSLTWKMCQEVGKAPAVQPIAEIPVNSLAWRNALHDRRRGTEDPYD